MSGKRLMKTSGRPVALLVSLALILTAVLGATAAYLMTQSDGITNTFTPAKVSCAVDESGNNGANKVIKVQNTGDADAYIRVAIIATWQKSDGTVHAKVPEEGKDYTVSLGDGWVKNTSVNCIYYCKTPVAAKNGDTVSATPAITVVSNNTAAPAGDYSLHVEVLAEAVQTVQGNSTQAAIYAWGVDPTTGNYATAG